MAKELELISLQDVIPYSIAGDKNVQAILKSADPQLQEVSQSVREAFILSRLDELPENVIDLLAWQWHVDFYEPELPIATKRELVRESISWHRKKGTKAAIISALEKLDFVPTIKEWYEPELQTEPHTFSVRGYYKDDQIDVDFLGEDTHEILTRIIENTKPVRSRLIKLTIAPIPIDLTDHICRWDVCSWEHMDSLPSQWNIITPAEPLDDSVCVIHDFERGLFNLSDTQFWDISSWDDMPYRLLYFGASFETGIFASLEWGEGDAAMLSPNLWDYSQWDYVSTYNNVIGFDFDYPIPVVIVQDEEQIISAFTYTDIICDTRPRWDDKTWLEHYSWLDGVRHEDITPEFIRSISGSLDWNDKREYPVSFWDNDNWDSVNYPPDYDAPLPKWSAFKTWQKSNTWDTTTELSATLEIDYQEE